MIVAGVFFMLLSHSEECRQFGWGWEEGEGGCLPLFPERQKYNVAITDVSDIWLLCVISYDGR